jgi:hypothetical protein
MYVLDQKRGEILEEAMSPIIMNKFLTNLKGVKDYRVLKTDFEKLQRAMPDRFETLNRYKMAAYDFAHIEQENPGEINTKQDDMLRDILTQLYKSIGIASWKILKDELHEEWTTFEVFGIKFNGREAIKKGIGITAMIIAISTTVSSFTLKSGN